MPSIGSVSVEELAAAYNEAGTIKGALLLLGISNGGNTFLAAKAKLESAGYELNIRRSRVSDEEIFCENSTVDQKTVRERYKALYGAAKCTICGCGSTWWGKPLSLQLDHINGVRNDNRLANLRIVCPNCHSQTNTYAGKKR